MFNDNTNDTTRLNRLKTMLLATLVAVSMFGAVAVGPAAAAGDVTITVEDSAGNAITDATVTLYDSADDTQAGQATTDSTGQVTFSSVADATYYANVSATGYEDTSLTSLTVSGAAVTQTATMTETPDEVLNTTVALDDTSIISTWAEATVDNSTDVTFTFTAENTTDDSSTQLSTETLSPAAGETVQSTASVTENQIGNYTQVRIVVEAPNSVDVNSTDYGTTQQIAGGGGSGGGGGLPGGAVYGVPVLLIVAVLLGVGYFWMEG